MAPIIISFLICLIVGLVFILAQPGPLVRPARRGIRKHKVNLLEDLGARAVWKDRGGDL